MLYSPMFIQLNKLLLLLLNDGIPNKKTYPKLYTNNPNFILFKASAVNLRSVREL